jgi:DNA-directed RNA polymerase specialized sigma24 family protein
MTMLKPATDTGVDGKHLRSIGEIDTLSGLSTLSDVVIGPNDDDPPIDMLLERYSFEYILKKVRQHQLINLFRPFVHSSALDHKLKDVAQDIHIKFWQCLVQKKPIQNYEAYIARMVHNELITEIRRCTRCGSKLTKTLSENESMLEDTIHLQPVEEVEQGIAVIQRMHETAIAVTKLPPKQRLAMTCSLVEEDSNLPLMKDILKLYGVNIEVAWPQDKKAKQRLQANLSPARQAIAKHLQMDYAPKRHPRSSD